MGVLIGFWFFLALVGGVIGSGKKMGTGGGFFLTLLLSVVGLIIVAASEPKPAPTVLERVEARPAEKGWHPDPLGRFDSRWYDGAAWTQHVGRVGADGSRSQFEDPL